MICKDSNLINTTMMKTLESATIDPLDGGDC